MSDKSSLEKVIDILPRDMKDIVEENIFPDEDIRVIVQGKTGEAVIVTDRRVCTINGGEVFQPFEKEIIKGVALSRRNRVGRFELFVDDPENYTAEAKEDDCQFAPDLSKNVVNFPYSKFPQFTAAEKHINALIGK